MDDDDEDLLDEEDLILRLRARKKRLARLAEALDDEDDDDYLTVKSRPKVCGLNSFFINKYNNSIHIYALMVLEIFHNIHLLIQLSSRILSTKFGPIDDEFCFTTGKRKVNSSEFCGKQGSFQKIREQRK